MIAMKEILCPVDLSPVSKHAVAHAAALARWYGARVHVLHVYSVLVPATVPPFAFAGPVVEGAVVPDLTAIHDDLAALVRAEAAGGTPIDTTVVDGVPAQQITAQARALAADVIVMGTHGHSRLERFLLGSVTERVLRTTTTPLLTVPPAAGEPSRFSNILCAIDFSTASVAALKFAMSLAQEGDGRITLLHVVDWPEDDEPLTSRSFNVPEYRRERQLDAEHRLEALIPGDRRESSRAVTLVRAGRPYRAILAAAAEAKSDLIVMGAHGRSALERLFIGSTTNHVIRSATCPVLTMGRAG